MKRRILAAFFCCLLLFGCVITASADSAATYVENITTITSDGECNVTLRITIHLESVTENITFPVPLGATDIELNNSRASTDKGENAILVDDEDKNLDAWNLGDAINAMDMMEELWGLV